MNKSSSTENKPRASADAESSGVISGQNAQSTAQRETENESIDRIIELALAEDIFSGDITAESVVPEQSFSKASLLLKEPALVAGLSVFEKVLRRCDPGLKFNLLVKDPQQINQVPFRLATMQGKSRAVLSGERSALNLLQRMSGIATLTRRFVELAAPFGIEILDTRKTMPGLRVLDKLAVRLGGGTNHRFGLYDGILIKDNHRAIAGGVAPAVERARLANPGIAVEVEVNNLDQLREALQLKVERIMLDNMSPEEIKAALSIAAGRSYIEVSGGVTIENINKYLIEGVNGISIGALTHSVKNIDISLEFEE